jgi:cysteine-rich repeat protein/predicted outer membrane repeat protein
MRTTRAIRGVGVLPPRDGAPAKVIAVTLLLIVSVGTAHADGSAAAGSEIRVVSDSTWKYSETLQAGWETVAFDDSSWSTTIAPSGGLCECGSAQCRCADVASEFLPSGSAVSMWGRNPVDHQVLYLRKSFVIDEVTHVAAATIHTLSDDDHDLYFNGTLLGSDWDGVAGPALTRDLRPYLVNGVNVIAVRASDSYGICQRMCVEALIDFCGNGILDPGEECDDGNRNPSDGCTNACTICGNHIVTSPEACDDGNLINGDGCDRNCTRTACGNGVRSANEQCDDGNTSACDGCSPTCKIEPPGYRCGDGLVSAACDEACDDGNTSNNDACRNDCQLNVCGDGFLNPSAEECDDGNTTSCDGCSSTCRNEPGPVCGDGVLNTACGEQCDDGNTSNNDACRNDCQFNVCGDDFRNPIAEECDDGNRDPSDGCTNACTICGNGAVTPPERCDDGNRVDDDGCMRDCRLQGLVVGEGTLEGCTEAALDAALTGGRVVTFDCGADAVTITITSTKTIAGDTTIDGGGSITISGGDTVCVFAVNSGVSFVVQNLTIADGRSAMGGGIRNVGGLVTVTDSTLAGNHAGSGGGIHNAGTLTISNSTFSANSADSGNGGAIYKSDGTLTVSDSTFSGNSASDSGGGVYSRYGEHCERWHQFCGRGGCVRVCDEYIFVDENVTLFNSTFSGNSASAGGAIFNVPWSKYPTYSAIRLQNNVVADSPSGGNCAGGDIIDNGHNLQWPGTDCGETIRSLAPLLDPAGLQDNGGLTQTIALLADSPAIDAGDPEVCANAPVDGLDQRGYVRPGTGYTSCSIGAFEYNSPGPPAPCDGDCNGNGAVTSEELITMVNIALGTAAASQCEAADTNGDGAITVAELLASVNSALTGCPAAPTPVPTATPSPTATRTPMIQCGPGGTCPVGFRCVRPGYCMPVPATPSTTPTLTPTPTRTPTARRTPSATRTQTVTQTPTRTRILTRTRTSTATRTPTRTRIPTRTATVSS